MNKELEQYYSSYNKLFRSRGWKQLQEELNKSYSQTNSVETTEDADNFLFRKGQLNVLRNLITFEAQINAGQEAVEEEEKVVEAEEPDSLES